MINQIPLTRQATIALEDNDKLTMSCHYRSPSYNEDDNNKFIEEFIEEVLYQAKAQIPHNSYVP